MVVKTTNTPATASDAGQSKMAQRRTTKQRSHVTEARAKAQRARLDSQAKARHVQEEQEEASHQTQSKKTARQEAQARQRVITTLIEAYIQDHIGGNASKKTVEWHRTALGLMQRFFHETLDITHIDEVEAEDISAML